MRQHYREGQEDQLAALGLVLNMIVLWNTRYTQRILKEMQATHEAVYADDVDRLSPLGFDHITILGRYHFVVPESVRRGEFRPLRQQSRDETTGDRDA